MPAGGWSALPLGCGGLTTGFDIAPDGTVVIRSDVGNCYYWSGRYTSTFTNSVYQWMPIFTYTSMPLGYSTFVPTTGGYDIALAHSDPTHLYVISANDNGATNTWALYYSTNGGVTLSKVSSPTFANADPNGTTNINGWKNATGKVVVDPNNSSVVYLGMPQSSGQTVGVFRSTDGTTFSALTTNGTTLFPNSTVGSGTSGIIFDTSQGTTTVSGQTRTKRIIVPVGGAGIYESTDGGQNFTEVYVSAGNSATFNVFTSRVDFDGVIYMSVVNGDLSASASVKLMRYRSGVWADLFAATGWSATSYQSTAQNTLICDGRSGHQGYLTVVGPNGYGVGFTSTNANAANPNDVVWGGATGGQTINLSAPSYDVPWLAYSLETTNFLGGTCAIIDTNGDCWWTGQQGGIWKFSSIPNFGVSLVTTSTTYSRGAECTVSSDVCSAPGAPHPTMATQDVGIMRGTFTSYPTNYFKNQNRLDAMLMDWCASDPSFYVCKVDRGSAGTDYRAGYSTSYGKTDNGDISWVSYGVQPNAQWQFAGTADISNGSGGSGTILNVSALTSGNVFPGQGVTIGGVAKGTITAQLTGTTFGVGTYTIDTASLTASGAAASDLATQSGLIVATDPDHHVAIPMGFNAQSVPAYTTNARAASPTWQLCSGLPSRRWFGRGIIFGVNTHPMVTDRVNIGTVYLVDTITTSGTAVVYKSTDHGASWSSVATISDFGNQQVSPFLYSVPGHAGHLWLSANFTTNGGGLAGIWRSTNSGTTWTRVGITATFTATMSDAPGGTGTGSGPWLWVTGPVTGTITAGMSFTVSGTRYQISSDAGGGGGAGNYIATPSALFGATAVTATKMPGSTGFEFPTHFTLGKEGPTASYPTLFVATWAGSGDTIDRTIYYSTNEGASWSILGPTGTQRDFPSTMQLIGNPGGIAGDWNVFMRLYAMSAACGYGVFEAPNLAVAPLRLKVDAS